jgi:ABC-type multidrug transport system fused ATPase/permease subunit
MELGKMVQTGEFNDLVNREGLFRDLYRIQRGMNYS